MHGMSLSLTGVVCFFVLPRLFLMPVILKQHVNVPILKQYSFLHMLAFVGLP